MKLIDNSSGNVSQGITLTTAEKADKYKLSYVCSDIGSGKSYIRIYATLNDSTYKTYFMPIQFVGNISLDLSIDTSSTYLQFDVIGDATLTNITLATNDDPTIEYVKNNVGYWDRIKNVTNDIGKVRSEMLEGLLNLTVNAFANESGTITQENGVMTFLNGTTAADSTQAVQITGGAIRIANTKNADGSWNWTTAISGEGINAQTIIADTFKALDIAGANIVGGNMTSGTLTSCKMVGGELYIGSGEPPIDGDTNNYSGMMISSNGTISAYLDGESTYVLKYRNCGELTLKNNRDKMRLIATTDNGPSIFTDGGDLKLMAGMPGESGYAKTKIVLTEDGDIKISANNGSGKIIIDGDLDVWGTVSADNVN